jgi:hypothetical protein
MHETLHTYRFLSLRRKNTFPSFHASLIISVFSQRHPIIVKSVTNRSFHFGVWRRYASSIIIFVPWHYFFETIFEYQHWTPFLRHWCNMMYDVMLCKWCDVMQNDICRRSRFIFRCKPPLGAPSPFTSAESTFIFRCKPPLGASSPFTSAESTFIFRCKLCIPFGTTFEQKTCAALP